MAEKKGYSTKRFGARYGRSLKEKVAEIEKLYRGRHKCPYCGKINAKRLAEGIWYCRSCKTKFAAKAYSIEKDIIPKKEILEKETIKEEKEGAEE